MCDCSQSYQPINIGANYSQPRMNYDQNYGPNYGPNYDQNCCPNYNPNYTNTNYYQPEPNYAPTYTKTYCYQPESNYPIIPNCPPVGCTRCSGLPSNTPYPKPPIKRSDYNNRWHVKHAPVTNFNYVTNGSYAGRNRRC